MPKDSNKKERVFSLEEAAEFLGMSVEDVQLRAEVGRLGHVRMEGRKFWFSESALREYKRQKDWRVKRFPVYIGVFCAVLIAGFCIYRFIKITQSGNYEKEAAVLLKKKDFKLAATYLQEAVLSDPGNVSARLGYARLLGASDRLEEQEKQLRAVLAETPDSIEALQNLGILMMRKKQPEEAEKIFRQILKLEPGQFLANYQIAMILAGRGDMAGAKKYVNIILKARPGFGPGEILLADLFAGENKLDQANKIYAGQAKTNFTALLNQGIIYQTQGDFDKAAAVYGKIMAETPVIARAYNNMAWGMVTGKAPPDKQTIQRAFEIARKGFLMNPEDATISDTLGWILHLAGRDDYALKQLETAIKLSPGLGEAYFHKGSILLAQGKREEALAAFKIARENVKESSGVSVKTVDYFIEKAGAH